ncbi:MAG TPA: DPP IV N-terminal domain-containing protein, partial [Actinomycetota bacterium]|nr:DPP IV N-terminal domain-containing protein [Actinomycetota bacterium]
MGVQSRNGGAWLIVGLALAVGSQAKAQGQKEIGSVREALDVSARLAGSSGPASVNWIESGERFSYTTRGARGTAEVRVYNPETLADEALFDARRLTLPGTAEPIAYRSFEFGQDSRHLVFQTHFRRIYRNSGISDFYLYTLGEQGVRPLVKNARTADLSPSGERLGFERGGNLYVIDLEDGSEQQLTGVAGDSIFDGVFDWVYEEEFGFAQAWKWSPDSRRIAYWQTDERGVPVIQLTDWSEQHPDWF